MAVSHALWFFFQTVSAMHIVSPTVKNDPSPFSLCTSIVPFSISTIRFTTDNPKSEAVLCSGIGQSFKCGKNPLLFIFGHACTSIFNDKRQCPVVIVGRHGNTSVFLIHCIGSRLFPICRMRFFITHQHNIRIVFNDQTQVLVFSDILKFDFQCMGNVFQSERNGNKPFLAVNRFSSRKKSSNELSKASIRWEDRRICSEYRSIFVSVLFFCISSAYP